MTLISAIDVHESRLKLSLAKQTNCIFYRLNNLPNNNLASEVRVYIECPSERFPEDVKKPEIELFALRLALTDAQQQIPHNIAISVPDNGLKEKILLFQ